MTGATACWHRRVRAVYMWCGLRDRLEPLEANGDQPPSFAQIYVNDPRAEILMPRTTHALWHHIENTYYIRERLRSAIFGKFAVRGEYSWEYALNVSTEFDVSAGPVDSELRH